MPRKAKALSALQAEWYKRLKDEGFDDIEQDDNNLKMWSSQFFKSRWNPTLFAAKEEYYRLAGQFYYDHKFNTPLEQRVWGMHADAISIVNIIAKLQSEGLTAYKDQVQKILNDLTKIMVQRARER